MGRQTQDRATAFGTGVDQAIKRLATTYEVRGMAEKVSSYDNATVGSGTVQNEVEFAYNDFSQLTHDYQAHGGAVGGSTPKVQYGYANGSANTVRPTTMTYPDGRVLTFDYGTSGGIDDSLSRTAGIVNDDTGSTHLADYEYLGLDAFVETDYTEPELRWQMYDVSNPQNDPDTGDIYSGLDRFGRIKDNWWRDYGSSADADRIKYSYDRVGSRKWRDNTVDTTYKYDEKYLYDAINRLKNLDRGELNGSHNIINKTWAECWQLDETGNWRNYREDTNGNGTWDLDQNRTANKVNEITDITESSGPPWVTPVFNAAGNMTTVPKPSDLTAGYTCTYDAWNRLVKVVDGSDTVTEYQYDGVKRRNIKKIYASGVLDETRHLYYTEPSKWQVVEERVDTDTDPNRQFVWGLRYQDDLILRDRDTTGNGTLDERLYGLQDANWNLTGVAGTNGALLERYAYDGYGTSIVLTPAFVIRTSSNYDWETRFAGYRFDIVISFYHVRNRVLVPNLGWLQRDPIGLNGGINMYEYANSNPILLTDPTGEVVGLIVAVVIAGIVVLMLVTQSGCKRTSTPIYEQEDCAWDEPRLKRAMVIWQEIKDIKENEKFIDVFNRNWQVLELVKCDYRCNDYAYTLGGHTTSLCLGNRMNTADIVMQMRGEAFRMIEGGRPVRWKTEQENDELTKLFSKLSSVGGGPSGTGWLHPLKDVN